MIAPMDTAIDEIAAIVSCWTPNRTCTGRGDCACVPKSAAIATARAIAAELPTPLRVFPTGDGGVLFECFDDPSTIMFRGFECWHIRVQADGSILACDSADGERTWPS